MYIATPNYMHVSQSILCMNRDKHVLCEKLLVSNAEKVRLMIAASEKYNVTLMEAMKSTLVPKFRVVAERLCRLGKIRRYSASYVFIVL